MKLLIQRSICRLTICLTLLSGCGTGSQPTQQANAQASAINVNIDPAAFINTLLSSLQQTASAEFADWDWNQFINSFSSLLTGRKFTLQMQKITYQSTGANGAPQTMTGLLILPVGGSVRPSVPILMYQHTSQPARSLAPSQFLANQTRPTDYPEVILAAAIASDGYAVAMADYEGLGDNTSTQPYLAGAPLARQVIDMLKASRDAVAATNSPCTWNNQLFLMGYSEGGYVTMTTVRELQRTGEFAVTASAPLSGPYDLSGTMRSVLLADTPYKAPFFLPFILTSYNYVYGSRTALYNPATSMAPPFNTNLPPLFNGNATSTTINQAMGMSYNPVQLIAPKSILSQQFIAELSNPASPAVAILMENDAYRGWAPTSPMRLIHHPADELVPFANSQIAFASFSTAGAKPFVSLVPEQATINISGNSVQTVHYSAAFPELNEGWKWLDGFKIK